MDNNNNGFIPEGGNSQQGVPQPVDNNAYQQPAYANNAYQQPNYNNAYPQQQYVAPATNDFANQIANDVNDGTVAVAKKKSKLPLAIGGTLVGVAGVGALLFAFVAPVKNWAKLTFMKPEKYFASVEEQAFSEYSATLSETYGQAVKSLEGEGTTVSYGVEVTFGDKLMEIIREEASAEGTEIPDIILESFGADMSAASTSDKAGVNASVSLNGESVISAKLIYDFAEQMAYAQVPELSESYMSVSLGEYIEEYATEMGVDSTEINTDALISEEDMKRIIEDYANIVYSSIETVEIAKNEDIDVAGKEFKFSIMEFELTEEELYDIVIEVLETAADDDAIADMVNEFGADYDTVIEDAIESVETAMDEASDENYIVGRVYVDARGVIMGREYTVYSEDEETAVFSYILGADGDDVCFEAVSEADGEEAMTIEISRIGSELEGLAEVEGEEVFTIEGTYEDEAYTGTVALITPEDEEYGIEESKIEIGFEDLKTAGENDEFVTGKIFYEIPDDDEEYAELVEYGVDRLEIVFANEGSTQEISFVVGELVTLSVSAGVEEGADIDVPSDADAYDMETEMDAYLETVDYTPVVTKVLELLGIDDEYTAEDVVAMIEQSMAPEDDYDDWEEEDWGDDWDDEDWGDGEDGSDTDYYDTYDYSYIDIYSTVEVNAFGEEFSLPLKAEPFCSYFGADADEMIAVSDYAYLENGDDYAYFYNYADEPVRTGDCYVYELSLTQSDSMLVSVNGVSFGSSIEDINAAFGTDFNVIYGEVKIEDESYYDSVTFYLEDNKVVEIYFYGDDDYVEDYLIDGDSSDSSDSADVDQDYDYEYIDFMGTVKIQTQNGEFSWPCTYDYFAGYFADVDTEISVSPQSSDYAVNSDATISVDYYNPSYVSDFRTGDCYVSDIYVSEAGLVNVNGIDIGSTIDDINAAFGTDFAVTNGYVEIEDSWYYDCVQFWITDGVVSTFYIEADSDTIEEAAGVSYETTDENVDTDFDFGTGTVIE